MHKIYIFFVLAFEYNFIAEYFSSHEDWLENSQSLAVNNLDPTKVPTSTSFLPEYPVTEDEKGLLCVTDVSQGNISEARKFAACHAFRNILPASACWFVAGLKTVEQKNIYTRH